MIYRNAESYVQFVGFILASHATPQPTFTCSKLTIETLKQGVNHVHKLTIKTPERVRERYSSTFLVNFERISNLVLVFLLLTLNM